MRRHYLRMKEEGEEVEGEFYRVMFVPVLVWEQQGVTAPPDPTLHRTTT